MDGYPDDFNTFPVLDTVGSGRSRLSIDGGTVVCHPLVVCLTYSIWPLFTCSVRILSRLRLISPSGLHHANQPGSGCCMCWDVHLFIAVLTLLGPLVTDYLNLLLAKSCVPAAFHYWPNWKFKFWSFRVVVQLNSGLNVQLTKLCVSVSRLWQ